MALRAVSFDLFGTLVTADRPAQPAATLEDELKERAVPLPEDWTEAYATPQVELEAGAERSLSGHVTAVIAGHVDDVSREAIRSDVEDSVIAAFDRPVSTHDGAIEAVTRLPEDIPVGILSNCSVPGLVERTVTASGLEWSLFDTVVSSLECGWRKPDERAFEAVATELGVEMPKLVHIGDDTSTDGGVRAVGGTYLSTDEFSLKEIPDVVGENSTGGDSLGEVPERADTTRSEGTDEV